jgi:hypothetical protein
VTLPPLAGKCAIVTGASLWGRMVSCRRLAVGEERTASPLQVANRLPTCPTSPAATCHDIVRNSLGQKTAATAPGGGLHERPLPAGAELVRLDGQHGAPHRGIPDIAAHHQLQRADIL